MRCYQGIYVSNQDRTVPCGQCMDCRINRGRKWSARIVMEQAMTPWRSYFLTLTYNDKSIPLAQNPEYVQTLRKKPFLKWLDNQQAEIGAFRYYAVGEYGDRTRRPHYHMALFPSGDSQARLLLDAWQRKFGFTTARELDATTARYLANYTVKKLTRPDDVRLEENQEPEFRSSSRRPPLGHDFVRSLAARYKNGALRSILDERGDVEKCFRFDGIKYPIPDWCLTYLRRELGIPEREQDRLDHPGYLIHHPPQEAEQCPEKANARRIKLNAQTQRKTHRTHHAKL